jgi:pimeloyl-ACP methyl ester carboxylesterase
MADLLAVLDAVGSTTVSIVGHSEGGRGAMVFAATHPERTNNLVLIDDCTACHVQDDDYSGGLSPEMIEATSRFLVSEWGTGAQGIALAPSRHDDKAFRRWHGRIERLTCSPAALEENFRWFMDLDLRRVLPAIHVPTLLLWREGGSPTRLWNGRYLADHITDARLVLVPGTDEWFFTQAADEIVDHIEEFITGAPPVREPDRVLATVLFTDIVSSTERRCGRSPIPGRNAGGVAAMWRSMPMFIHTSLRAC